MEEAEIIHLDEAITKPFHDDFSIIGFNGVEGLELLVNHFKGEWLDGPLSFLPKQYLSKMLWDFNVLDYATNSGNLPYGALTGNLIDIGSGEGQSLDTLEFHRIKSTIDFSYKLMEDRFKLHIHSLFTRQLNELAVNHSEHEKKEVHFKSFLQLTDEIMNRMKETNEDILDETSLVVMTLENIKKYNSTIRKTNRVGTDITYGIRYTQSFEQKINNWSFEEEVMTRPENSVDAITCFDIDWMGYSRDFPFEVIDLVKQRNIMKNGGTLLFTFADSSLKDRLSKTDVYKTIVQTPKDGAYVFIGTMNNLKK